MTSKVRHVDIFSNDPLSGSEQLIARVWMNGGPDLELRMGKGGGDPAFMWSYLDSRVHIDRKKDPVAFLNALPSAIDATYVFASPVHEDDECPFADTHIQLAP